MVRRSTCHDHDLFDSTNLFICHSKLVDHDFSFFYSRRKCISNGFWLLIHFFQHKMFITAFFCGVDIPVNMCGFLLERFLIHGKKLHRIFRHPNDFFIFNKEYISCVFQYCRYIRSNDISTFRVSDDQRTVFSYRV